MRQTIYIETSIPSFYYEDRSDAAAVARREWTRQWWDDNNCDAYNLVSILCTVTNCTFVIPNFCEESY